MLDPHRCINNPSQASNARHIHSNNFISAAYYVKAPEDSGEILFYDPRAANEIRSPMFLTRRDELKKYLLSTKKPFMANFYKINRSKTNILMNKNGTPKGGKWSFDEDNRKKLPDKIDIPKNLKFQNTSHTENLKKFIEENHKTNHKNLSRQR